MTQVKICGLSTPETMTSALENGADFIGLVFYPPSPRHVELEVAGYLAEFVPEHIQTVGLFVNPDDQTLENTLNAVPLTMIQLHGDETPERVTEIKQKFSLPVMKAISITHADDLNNAKQYQDVADWLLFDAPPPTPPLAGGKMVGETPAGEKLIEKPLAGRKLIEETLAGEKLIEKTPAGRKLIEETLAGRKLIEETSTGGKKLIEETLAGEKMRQKQEGMPGGNGIAFDWDILKGYKGSKPWMLAGGLTPDNIAEALSMIYPSAVDVSSGVEEAPGQKNEAKIRSFLEAVKRA